MYKQVTLDEIVQMDDASAQKALDMLFLGHIQQIPGMIMPYMCTEEEGLKWEIKENDKIDILIPCYGQSKYIITCIKSCLNQTKKPNCIIVLLMDTYSQMIASEIKSLDPSCVHCISSDRMNTSAARNYLASISTAQWIVFLDADDTLQPNFIDVLSQKPCAVAFPSCVNKNINSPDSDRYVNIGHLSTDYSWKAICNNFTCLIRKSVFEELKFKEEYWDGGEDTDLIIRLHQSRKYYMYYTDKTWYNYIAPNDYSHQSIITRLKMYRYHSKWFAEEMKHSWNCVLRKVEWEYALMQNWTDEMEKNAKSTYVYINTGKRFKEMQAITFVLNRKCNMKCSYCFQDDGRLQDLSDEEIYENFDKALTWAEKKTGDRVLPQIMGGEPTIWSLELQRKILDRLKNYRLVYLNTNGTHLQESLFWKQNNFFIMVHEYIWQNKTPQEIRAKYEDKTNICINIIVRKGELDILRNFISLSPYDKDYDRIFFSPCDSGRREGMTEGMGMKELEEMSSMLKERFPHRLDSTTYALPLVHRGVFHEACSKGQGLWDIECIEMTVSPCCGEHRRWPLDEFNPDVVKHCEGCTAFGNIMPSTRG